MGSFLFLISNNKGGLTKLEIIIVVVLLVLVIIGVILLFIL